MFFGCEQTGFIEVKAYKREGRLRSFVKFYF